MKKSPELLALDAAAEACLAASNADFPRLEQRLGAAWSAYSGIPQPVVEAPKPINEDR